MAKQNNPVNVPSFGSQFSKDWKAAAKHPKLKAFHNFLIKRGFLIVATGATLAAIFGYQESTAKASILGLGMFMGLLVLIIFWNCIEMTLGVWDILDVDQNNLTREAYTAKNLYEFFFKNANEISHGLHYMADQCELVLTYDNEGDETPSGAQLQIDRKTIGGWALTYVSVDKFDHNTVTVETTLKDECLTIVLFGQKVLELHATEGFDPELTTIEQFYGILKDPNLRNIIAALIHNAKVHAYEIWTDEEDADGEEGGPAYRFAYWILGPRGKGEPFEPKTATNQ